jgi:hypothetical protein
MPATIQARAKPRRLIQPARPMTTI